MSAPTPEAVFAQVAKTPGAAWLDSGLGAHPHRAAAWSILAFDPVEVVTDADAFPEACRRPRSGANPNLPFAGGFLGYVGFGAGHRTAPVPKGQATPEPDVFLARYDGALCYRHADQRWFIGGTPRFRRLGEALLESVPALLAVPPPTPPANVSTIAAGAYQEAVEQVRLLLAAGDCYQINLTRPVFVREAGDAFAAYRRLRQSGAAYGAFLRVDERIAVLSNSPECLLTVQGNRLCSVPIKGTAARGATPDADAQNRVALWESDKEQAELTMIVDLVRNDLGKVAATGTVAVDARVIHTHPTLHHASWPVHASLADGLDAWDALSAVFPPGSVTGAPKVRACERIAELEPHPRGVYCGAIGYVADSGNAAFSVAIRVAVFDGPDARYHVGGGIVIDSDPVEEWNETRTKEAALARAITGYSSGSSMS